MNIPAIIIIGSMAVLAIMIAGQLPLGFIAAFVIGLIVGKVT